jgi:PilZ domain
MPKDEEPPVRIKQPRLAASEPAHDASRAMTRKADRRPVSGSVLIQSGGGEQISARLRDLSAYGCNLACEADWLRLGRFISIRIGSDRTIQAIVRWSRDGTTGVEFLRPISDADAEKFGNLG